ncbi:MAG: hypothetical protein ABR981_05075 [Candidatus Micrarchaeaceae archaeon]|jgi:uncharacterized protein YxjI
MEPNIYVIHELIGKTVLVKTHLGDGTKDSQVEGGYIGILLEYDGDFLKLEYEVKKFEENNITTTEKKIVLIDSKYIISVEEYLSKTE